MGSSKEFCIISTKVLLGVYPYCSEAIGQDNNTNVLEKFLEHDMKDMPHHGLEDKGLKIADIQHPNVQDEMVTL